MFIIYKLHNMHVIVTFCCYTREKCTLSYDIASGSEITSCNKIDNHLWFTDLRKTL